MYGDPQAFDEGFRGAIQDITGENLPISAPFQQLLQRGFATRAGIQAGDVPVEEYYQNPANVKKLLSTPANLTKYSMGFLGEVKLPGSEQPIPEYVRKGIAGGLEVPEWMEDQIKYSGMNIADIQTAGSIRNLADVQDALIRAQIPGMLGLAQSGEEATQSASGLDDLGDQTLGMIKGCLLYTSPSPRDRS